MRSLIPVFLTACSCIGAATLPVVLSRSGDARTETIPVKGLSTGQQYSLLYSLSSLQKLSDDARVHVEIVQGTARLAGKTLHAGDPDLYTQFRVKQDGDAALKIRVENTGARYSLQINRWPLTKAVRAQGSSSADAMPIELGKTVFASGDDSEYIPIPGTPRKELPGSSHWYRFEFDGKAPKLLYVGIDLMDRDQVPVNVQLFREVSGKVEEQFEGEDPVTLPHEVQALPGNKFIPRLIREPGTYFIAVRASHPEYKLRTRLYDPPPYTDAQKAVRTALDYVLSSGDSWHANTPRRGGILDRVSSVHQETSLCVACHATHFPQRAQLYATRNGYPVANRPALQFLTERFYNNPRPLYGFEEQGAVWARMISAPANVLGRMSHLMQIFEDQVSGSPRPSFHRGVAEYLKLYYAGRDKLPGDETNGNTPLVSTHEVAWYAWAVTRDERIPEMIATAEVKNNIDLCYQTLALAEMDRERYAPILTKNVDRLLKLQRPDGQWSARFEENQPAVEFQTGHALWALHAAGVPASHPQVAKAIAFLLKRQEVFGGWLDPLQSFENFRTPFRETQMAILALSAYFPVDGRPKGWNTPAAPEKLSDDPAQLLAELDAIWDKPSAAILSRIEAEAKSNDALIRQAALEALGRIGAAPDIAALADPSKLVQRTAAWALRLAHSKRKDLPLNELKQALASSDDRMRWGATRVFAAHFAALARRDGISEPIQRLAAADPVPSIRMNAVKALWQLWFWTPDTATKSGIEDTLLAALGKEQHAGVALNIRHAIYNLADENIRYLYNNWVPLLARQEDRDQSIKGRLAIEDRLAGKFAHVLESGSDRQKLALLTALTELPLRRGDVYDLEADLQKTAPPVYNRIGNDIEQIAFFGPSAEKFATALQPLLNASDAEMRRLAAQAVLLVRDTRFGAVNRIAGPAGQSVKSVMAKIETMPEAAEVAKTLKPPPVNLAKTSSGAAPRVKPKLDEAYFRGYVQPILEKRGKDGYACVHCHASHTLFSGTYSTALNVVDPSQPEKSLLLLKPTSSAESEGIAGADSVAHGGGVRWAKDSPEYVTILEWIKGAKE